MHSHHRGEAIYAAETDVHYPTMTVGDTLSFAACARVSRHLVSGLGKTDLANHLRDVVMAMFGISHTIDTPVGNDFVRGISGGERKRVTICEAVLSGSPIQCWNNATRGLDSLNAIDFCKNLRLGADMFHTTVCVSMYQSPQIAFDQFDKVTVLYEGQQIFFGRINVAKQYFIDLGFECPPRQTTPDFLTSMTAPGERVIRSGFERTAPRTSEQFTNAWQHSSHYKALQTEIEQYKTEHPIIGPDAEAFRGSKQAQQAKAHRRRSPYILSFSQQTQLCLWRGWRQLISDPGLTIGALVGNLIMALIVGSVFYNLNQTSSSFFQRGALIFFACILNAFASALEVCLALLDVCVWKHKTDVFLDLGPVCETPYRREAWSLRSVSSGSRGGRFHDLRPSIQDNQLDTFQYHTVLSYRSETRAGCLLFLSACLIRHRSGHVNDLSDYRLGVSFIVPSSCSRGYPHARPDNLYRLRSTEAVYARLVWVAALSRPFGVRI